MTSEQSEQGDRANAASKAHPSPRALQPATAQGQNGTSDATGAIAFRDKIDILDYARASGTGQRQPMRGFSPEYTDIVDYIIRSTHKMWEEGGVGLLYDHYAHNTTVWSDWGYTFGREQTMGYVLQRLAGFPDFRLFGDAVIWTGNDADGFRTCHRFVQTGTNDGWSKYGPPTGKRVQFRAFANCIVRENRITEEWLVHDELTVVRQLGLDVDEVLRELTLTADVSAMYDIVGEVPRTNGQLTPPQYTPKHPGTFDVEDFIRGGMHAIWNWRLLNKIPDYYASTCPIHATGNRKLYGHGDARAQVLHLLAAFPDGMLEVDDCYANGDGDAEHGYRAAVRWTFTGTHRGLGTYGKPTGKQVRILGTSEFRIRDAKIVEEWTVWNELALLWKLRYQ